MHVGVFQRTAQKEVLLASLFDKVAVSSLLFYLAPPGNRLCRLAAARSGRQDRSKISAFCGEVSRYRRL